MEFFVQCISKGERGGAAELIVSQPKNTKSGVHLDNKQFNIHTVYAYVGDQAVPILAVQNPSKPTTEKMMYIYQSLLRLDIWFDHWSAANISQLNTEQQIAALERIVDDALVIRARKEHIDTLVNKFGYRG